MNVNQKETNLSFSETNSEGKVLCQICGKPFNIITANHLLKHNVTMEQYKIRYPGLTLASDQYRAKQKFNKTQVFKKEQEKQTTKIEDDIIEDFEYKSKNYENLHDDFKEIIVNEEPKVEEFDIPTYKEEKPKNIVYLTKARILNVLLEYFPNVKENYLIRKLSITNRLEFEYISDFADPILKVDVEFPNTFWHNADKYQDAVRNEKLMREGWKVIEIYSKAPSDDEIRNAIR